MSINAPRFVRIAVPVPLAGLFDYTLPPEFDALEPGCRVKIRFGNRQLIGLSCGNAEASECDPAKVRPIDEILDTSAILTPDLLALAEQASRYYHHPIGEVYATMLPNALSQGRALDAGDEPLWQLSAAGKACSAETLSRAPRQSALLQHIQDFQHPVTAADIGAVLEGWRPALKALIDKGLLEAVSLPDKPELQCRTGPDLNDEQRAAIEAVGDDFHSYLLDGITGSGKTEVYLRLIQRVLERGQQALVLVPEIGLTPQLIQRFADRFQASIVSLHSNMTDLERLRAWRLAAEGRAHIVLGTRSALFTPLQNPGIIIVDEEHDGSFKQQDGFRYNARDLAILRARILNIPILLGSATPALESLHNASQNRYTLLRLTQRAGNARPPRIAVVDSRRNFERKLTPQLQRAMQNHLEAGNQVLLFLNRRGYAPSLTCPGCGWYAQCQRCDASMTLHTRPSRLRCHHCGSDQLPPQQCPNCHYGELQTQGLGTEQLEQELNGLFPDTETIRIDRDSTRRKGSLEAQLERIHAGGAKILLGTQMLAKGHHFPQVTLVGILDCDRGFFSADFRGTEHMAQLILQVAGRAGRAELPGEVLIESSQPENPLLHTLVTQGYRAFSRACLEERRLACLPPFSHMALLRAESAHPEQANQFLRDIAGQLSPPAGVDVLGPIPAPMERRAGRYRAQLLLSSGSRSDLHKLLSVLNSSIRNTKRISRQVRWSLDIDPTEMI